MPKIKVEIVIPEALVEKVADVIAGAANSGNIGDGKIFIHPASESARVDSA